MTIDTELEAIRAYVPFGNYLQDREMWLRIDAYIMQDVPMESKIEAIKMIDKICGENEVVTEQDVLNYMESKRKAAI